MGSLSRQGIDLIKRFEGFSPNPYLCPAGKWTIGYGSTYGITKDTPPITQEQAEALLLKDIESAIRSVLRLTRVPLEQNQFDALVSFVFNLGGGNYQASTLRQKLNRGDLIGASDQFLRWVYAGGRKLPGLVLRRAAERALFLNS